jgi:hypothetical protein
MGLTEVVKRCRLSWYNRSGVLREKQLGVVIGILSAGLCYESI